MQVGICPPVPPCCSAYLRVGLDAVCQNLQRPFLEQLLFLLLELIYTRVSGHRTEPGAFAIFRRLRSAKSWPGARPAFCLCRHSRCCSCFGLLYPDSCGLLHAGGCSRFPSVCQSNSNCSATLHEAGGSMHEGSSEASSGKKGRRVSSQPNPERNLGVSRTLHLSSAIRRQDRLKRAKKAERSRCTTPRSVAMQVLC